MLSGVYHFFIEIFKISTKKSITGWIGTGLLIGFLLPFVMLRDFYPFHRFAMFAEPLQEQNQQEAFQILFDTPQGQTMLFTSDHYRISRGNLETLKRRAFYRGEVTLLLSAFANALPQTKNWRLLRTVPTPTGTDTTHVIVVTP